MGLIARATESRFVRFLAAGGVNTLFGLAVYAGCITVGIPVWVALPLSMAIGVAFNFVTFGAYAFRDFSWRRAPRFVGAYGVLYLVNLAALDLLRTVIPGPIQGQVVLTVPMALLSYVLMSRFVFTKGAPR